MQTACSVADLLSSAVSTARKVHLLLPLTVLQPLEAYDYT